MASGYTTKLRLNQWAAADKFLREEFNLDNQRIEDACVELYGQSDALNTKIGTETGALRQQLLETTGALETRLETETADIRRQLDPASYHIYQLMLQNYYDGKYAGYKKAMVFDGFQDASQVAAVTPGAYLDTAQKQVRILTQGAQNIDTGFAAEVGSPGNPGYDANICSWLGSDGATFTLDVPIQPSGYGTLQSVTLRLAPVNNLSTYSVTVSLMDGGQVLGSSQTVTLSGNTFQNYTFTFSGGIAVAGLHTYTLRITNASRSVYLRVVKGAAGGTGMICTFSPISHTNGGIQTTALPVGSSYTRSMAWARHSGGLGITISAGGNTAPFQVRSTGNTQTLDGVPCTESAFALEDAPVSADGRVILDFALNTSGGNGILYDYGIIFI